ncbi:MAG: TAT-variant-translocated molybdopterin oxidoreductase [Cyclobacteriaceae bacterium]
MKSNNKTYWKGLEELKNDPGYVKRADREFPDYLPVNSGNDGNGGTSRRDFLKLMGFGIAAASLASCEAPVRKAIPYLNKPVDVDPGVPNYYASTYYNNGDTCSIVVKTREGRPIKIEGNKLSKITQGGTSAQVEASVLSLYDQTRLQQPVKISGDEITKAEQANEFDREIINALRNASGTVYLVSNTIASPTTKKAIGEFTSRFSNVRHIQYDPISAEGILKANERSLGERIVPSYDLSQAEVIVSLGADFLGTWLSPVEFNKQYSKTRKLGKDKKKMSRHFQFETVRTLTGANADYRTPIKPSEEGAVAAALYNIINGGKSESNFAFLNKAADALRSARGRSVVVSGSNDPDVQEIVNDINASLGNYGTIINTAAPLMSRQGNDADMSRFIQDVQNGRAGGVIIMNANPVYDHPMGAMLGKALAEVDFTLSTNYKLDETASLCKYVIPDSHFLESWNDAEPKKGYYSLCQPAITPIFNTRQAQESLLVWAGNTTSGYYEYLQQNWQSGGLASLGGSDFQEGWDIALFNGVVEPENAPVGGSAPAAGASGAISRVRNKKGNGIEMAVYAKTAIGSGSQANNPWLQEMPDPVSKATWDNYLTISLKMANELDIKMSDNNTVMVSVKANGQEFTLPALIQPGQANGTVGLAMGYGRTAAGKVADGVGVNAYPLLKADNSFVSYNLDGVEVVSLGESYDLALTQTHQTFMGRQTVIQETILSRYKKDPAADRYNPVIATAEGPTDPDDISLWKGHKYPNHHWGLVVDMNSCTGCGACTISCQAENNVPVVGREEVVNRREMHWIRIDRYYSSSATSDDEKEMEKVAENPDVVFQPMMCQHCNNAPCETVCPVVATTHSTEGLNQMTYNRCIGTRYCANNCPYKVRRFNWFKYHDNDQFADVNTSMNGMLGRMVLNPDVTVRARGVMEKCSMCVQRIQAGKLEAKKKGRRPIDGEINTACASSCPADALIFGDMNDPESQISKTLREDNRERAYHVLEEIHVQPNVYYLTKVRNKDEENYNEPATV